MTQGNAGHSQVWLRLWIGAALLLAAACADEPAGQLGPGPDALDGPALAVQLTCAVDVEAATMACDPSSPYGTVDGPDMNLIIGSQHRFVRMGTATIVPSGDYWQAHVTVQNLTLQPMGTADGVAPQGEGVRVFFVDEPDNGVEIMHHDGQATFTGSEEQKFYAYAGTDLGADGILSPGEASVAKFWRFQLHGAATFKFSVLVATTVPDPGAYSVRLTRIDSGENSNCGDGADGKVYCWGYGYLGQLGDGVFGDRTFLAPVSVPEGVTLSNVAVGDHHACADGSNGQLYCWGSNQYGQLGDGGSTNSATPVAVAAPEGVGLSNASAGGHHTCARGDDGGWYCWGANGSGALGNSTTTPSLTPVAVKVPLGVTLTRLVLGYTHTCAEGDDGRAYCWGHNLQGQLGDGTVFTRNVPTPVRAPEGVALSRVSAGKTHTCAQGDDGKAYCWGGNADHQLGDGGASNRNVPTAVAGPMGVTLSNVGAGAQHTCAVGGDGKAYCWGKNNYGALGDGTQVGRSAPVAVSMPAGVTFASFAGGTFHTCGLSTGSGVYCWGHNASGQLGDATRVMRLAPVAVAGTRGP